MKPRARVNPISKKRAAAHPELLRGNSTILRSSSPSRSSQTPKSVRKAKLSTSGTFTKNRKSKPRARNAKRAKANHERAYGAKAKFIRALCCHFCGSAMNVEAAHCVTGGVGRKAASSTLIPMCGPSIYIDFSSNQQTLREGCHRHQHRVGWPQFMIESSHKGADQNKIAAMYERNWQRLARVGGAA